MKEDEEIKPTFKTGRLIGNPGQPLQIVDEAEVVGAPTTTPLARAVGRCLRAYRKAVEALVTGKFAATRDRIPPQWRVPCDIWMISCLDGMIVRYDRHSDEGEPKIRMVTSDQPLLIAAPLWSCHFVHFPVDSSSYMAEFLGPGFPLCQCDLRHLTSTI